MTSVGFTNPGMVNVPGFFARRTWVRPALAVLGVFLSASTALAYVAEVDISEVAYIYNEQDEFRVLFKFDDLQIPDSFIVDFAAIIIPVSEVSSEIPIEVYAVSRDWSASSVKWDYPWQQAGADFSDTCLTRWIIHPGVGYPGHYIVVTEYIQRIVKGHQDLSRQASTSC